MKTSILIATTVLTQVIASAQNITQPSSTPTFVPTSAPTEASAFTIPPNILFLLGSLVGAMSFIAVFIEVPIRSVNQTHSTISDEERAELEKCCRPHIQPADKLAYYTLVWFHFYFQWIDPIISYPWHAVQNRIRARAADSNGKVTIKGCELLCLTSGAMGITFSGILTMAVLSIYPALALTASVLLIGPDATNNLWANFTLGAAFLVALLYALPFAVIQCTEQRKEKDTPLFLPAVSNSESDNDSPKTNPQNCGEIVWQKWKNAKHSADKTFPFRGDYLQAMNITPS